MPDELHVVATAGHVDHGKSTLILRLTGMDPDRWDEEKRRGLTIDLGFAWTPLPSGREVGFVDVPGHERFIRNMLAGVGPVRLVLFVVAADEGWKPQSEEHLQILDALGVDGAVVALTKRDLVDGERAAATSAQVRERLSGTRLERAPIVEVSAHTGHGLDDLRDALDWMIADAPPAATNRRPRLFVDRVFTIRGAGTVVTGTLTGGPLDVGQEAELLPAAHRARIRGLQSHKRSLRRATPVSRVAVNLASLDRSGSERGDILALPGQWQATQRFEGSLRAVRGLAHALTARGAYKVYAGSAERDARIRLYGVDELRPGTEAFVRVTLARPLVIDAGDGFVLREAGRRETVAGGSVLDAFPPERPGPDPGTRLRARVGASRDELALRLVLDRGAMRARDVGVMSGGSAEAAVRAGAVDLGGWVASTEFVARLADLLVERVRRHHERHPLQPGLDVGEARAALVEAGGARGFDASLADAIIDRVVATRSLERHGSALCLPGRTGPGEGREEAQALIRAIRDAEPTPPSITELVAAGHPLELIRALCSEGRLVRVSPDLAVTPDLIAEAERILRSAGAAGQVVTVSSFREALGTSRKYALPLLEHFDQRGLTRRQGDARVVRG